MKHKVSELAGALLDAAVAKCEGYGEPVLFEADHFGEGEAAALWFPHPSMPPFPVSDWRPSSAWVQGGPIIERERLPLTWGGAEWESSTVEPTPLCPDWRRFSQGPTPLIAAMRTYVASKFGEEVDLP